MRSQDARQQCFSTADRKAQSRRPKVVCGSTSTYEATGLVTLSDNNASYLSSSIGLVRFYGNPIRSKLKVSSDRSLI